MAIEFGRCIAVATMVGKLEKINQQIAINRIRAESGKWIYQRILGELLAAKALETSDILLLDEAEQWFNKAAAGDNDTNEYMNESPRIS